MQPKDAAVHPAEGINGSNPHHTGPTARPKPTAAMAEDLKRPLPPLGWFPNSVSNEALCDRSTPDQGQRPLPRPVKDAAAIADQPKI
jgi:hypothetical protein